MSNGSNILSKLQELNKKKSIVVYLPSLKKKVKFLPFTLKQQKSILAAMPEDAKGLITFNSLFNSVISDNAEEGIDASQLNHFDRLSIVLSYRASSLGDVVKTEDGEIEINKVIDNITNYNYDKLFNVKKVSVKDLSAEVKIPNNEYDEKIANSVAKLVTKDTPSKQVVSELYTSEILKFIQSITIEKETINLLDIPYNDKIEIIEALPGNFVKLVMNFIEEIKNVENELTTVDGVKLDITNQLFS